MSKKCQYNKSNPFKKRCANDRENVTEPRKKVRYCSGHGCFLCYYNKEGRRRELGKIVCSDCFKTKWEDWKKAENEKNKTKIVQKLKKGLEENSFQDQLDKNKEKTKLSLVEEEVRENHEEISFQSQINDIKLESSSLTQKSSNGLNCFLDKQVDDEKEIIFQAQEKIIELEQVNQSLERQQKQEGDLGAIQDNKGAIRKEKITNINWTNVYHGFAERLKELWNSQDFKQEEVESWIAIGCQPTDYDLVSYLKKKGYTPKRVLNLSQLREKYTTNLDWNNIEKCFGYYRGYQEEWEDLGFNYWETKKWIEAGLNPEDAYFAIWLAKKTHQTSWENLELERAEYKKWKKTPTAQEWLECSYPSMRKTKIIKLRISDKKLREKLIIDGKEWAKLESMDCSLNQLTKLIFNNCLSLTKIDACDNVLTELVINNCPEITVLLISHNSLVNLELSNLPNLTKIDCKNNQLTDNYLLKNLARPEQLTHLIIDSKNFSPQYLDLFSKLVNLERLKLTNWKVINVKTMRLILIGTELKNIQTRFQRFFTKWNIYIKKQDQIIQRKRWIEYCRKIKWISMGGGLTSGFLIHQTDLSSSLSATLTATGATFWAIADYSLKSFQRQTDHLRDTLRKNSEFQTVEKKMLIDYEKLIKRWRELSTLGNTPTNSEELNSILSNFLKEVPEGESKKSAHDLQNDWVKIDELVTNFVQEVANHRTKICWINKRWELDNEENFSADNFQIDEETKNSQELQSQIEILSSSSKKV